MTLKGLELDLPQLTSWTRHLTFKCKNEFFHVYVVYLHSLNLTSLQLQSIASKLPHEELKVLSDKVVFNRRRDYVLGRYAARMAIQTALGIKSVNHLEKESTFHILPGVFNQPVIISQGLASMLGVSISHQDGCAVAVAFDRKHPMAIDLERIDIKQTYEFEQLVNLQERDFFDAIFSSLSKIEKLCLFWTSMEALGKVMGCGLTVPPEFLEVAYSKLSIPIKFLKGTLETWYGSYQNCPQYSWYSWRVTNYWITFVAPAQSQFISCDLFK